MKSPSLPYRLRAARGALECAKKTPYCLNVTKLVLAGHSNGARVAATLATELLEQKEEKIPAFPKPVACLLFSYPLHAPGNISGLREDEVLALKVPTLFVRGRVLHKRPCVHALLHLTVRPAFTALVECSLTSFSRTSFISW